MFMIITVSKSNMLATLTNLECVLFINMRVAMPSPQQVAAVTIVVPVGQAGEQGCGGQQNAVGREAEANTQRFRPFFSHGVTRRPGRGRRL